jgi:predicted phage-related endonuclease
MIELDLVQGTAEWLAERLKNNTASEAPMMMGVSKHISRTKLLDSKKGWTTEVDEYLQKIFDAGHKSEAMARPLAAKIANSEFYPVVGLLENTRFMASFDGLTMMEDIVYEHKLYNKVLAENVLNCVIGPEYYWQLEHQLLVSGANKALFVCSDGTEEKFYSMWYESVPERRAELIAGWEQFDKDLDNHVLQAKTEKVVADPVKDLPALVCHVKGSQITTNLADLLPIYRERASFEMSIILETEQDFENKKAFNKRVKLARAEIALKLESVKTEFVSYANFESLCKEADVVLQKLFSAGEKQVKEDKEKKRQSIFNDAVNELNAVVNEASSKAGAQIPNVDWDVLAAMKGKSTIDSLKNAASTEVANAKIQINASLTTALDNAQIIKTLALDYRFLFNDWKQIAFTATEHFTNLVKTRLAEHKQVEADKAEALRAQIQREEEAKAQAKVAADKAEAERLERENKAKEEAKIAEEKRKTLEEANEIARRALEVDRLKQVKIEEEAHAENNRLKRVESEGAYERNISEERLEQRTGAKHTQSAQSFVIESNAKIQSRGNEQQSTTTQFMKQPSKMSMPIVEHDPIAEAFFRGFLSGYAQQEFLNTPNLEAGRLAKEYSNNKTAA